MVTGKIPEKELKHKSRRLSIKEGIFAASKNSFGDRFIHPFAIAIGTSNSMVALLSSITSLLGPLSQLFSSNLFEKQSRKKVILKAVFLESLIWIPFIAIALAYYQGISIGVLPTILLLTFSIYTLIGNAMIPPWFSWMGDIVDKKYRGRWFSKRTLILGFVTVIIAISASFFLDYSKQIGKEMVGFAILFTLALISRAITWKVFKKQYEPKLKVKKDTHFSFIDFLKQAPKTNFGNFAIFRSLFAFSGAIFVSVFAVYLLRYLNFKYSTYMIILLAETIFSLTVMRFWGSFADKYGNYKVLAISTMIIPVLSVLWILNPSPIYLIFVPALISGVVWSGFKLAEGNFIYDNISKEKRSRAVSYYNMLLGIGAFSGALITATLIKFEKIFFIDSIIAIFIIAGIIRMVIAIWWLPKFKEVRKTKKLNTKYFGKNLIKGIRPNLTEEIHEIASIKNYLKD